jgi:hypothetical protein
LSLSVDTYFSDAVAASSRIFAVSSRPALLD